MATTPCTLVIFTTDKYNLSPEEVYIVMQQIFRYGVKDVSLQGEKVFVKLSYSPKAKTLKKKFGNLPIRYMRAKFETDEQFNALEKVVHKFKFNLTDEDPDDEEHLQLEGQKRKYLEAPQVHHHQDEHEEEEEDIEQAIPKRRKRKVENGETSKKRSGSKSTAAEEYNNFSQHLDLLD